MDLEVVYVEMSKYCWHNNLVCPSYISVKESLERLVESGVTEQLTQQDIKAMLLNKKIAMFDDPLDAWGGV
jgi:hypothetical protein